jgi:iron complex transport system substrate-binding protein
MPSSRGRSPLRATVTGAYLSLSFAAGMSLLAGASGGAELPSVASINLCADQLLLSVALPEQILSLSWLASDPEESMLADEAARYPRNFGSAEEVIQLGADVVLAGTLTSPFTRELLRRLGARVVEIEPETSLDDTYRNLLAVGAAIDRAAEAEDLVAEMRARVEAIQRRAPNPPRSAIVIRPGGFTIGRETLANDLLELAGLRNDVAELDRWGSLSVEALLSAEPEYIVITRYRMDDASLANAFFAHPALQGGSTSQQTLAIEANQVACGAPASLAAAEALVEQMGSL